jgi:hypothetical protein
MPILSMFYGIIIRMYLQIINNTMFPTFMPNIQRKRLYLSIVDGTVLAGKFTNSKTRLVQAWIEIHREELNADWQLAVNGEEVFKIEPLK